MKKILLAILVTMGFTTFAYAAGGSTIDCTCEATVGIPTLPSTTVDTEIKVSIDAGGYYEATGAEADIVVAYECLQQKDSVLRIYKIKSIKCND